MIEQGEPTEALYLILNGTADALLEQPDGQVTRLRRMEAGEFFGELSLVASERAAHVVAGESLTCLVLSRTPIRPYAGRGAGATIAAEGPATEMPLATCAVDVTSCLHRKLGALARHRTQYPIIPSMLPHSLLEKMLGTEFFCRTASRSGNGAVSRGAKRPRPPVSGRRSRWAWTRKTDCQAGSHVGTCAPAIRGASAMAALDAVIRAEDTDVSFALTTILLSDVIAGITYPVMGHAAGLSEHALGLFAGTAINNISSLVAATHVNGHQAAAYGPEGGDRSRYTRLMSRSWVKVISDQAQTSPDRVRKKPQQRHGHPTSARCRGDVGVVSLVANGDLAHAHEGRQQRPSNRKDRTVTYPDHPEYSQRPPDHTAEIAPPHCHGGVTTLRRRRPIEPATPVQYPIDFAFATPQQI